MNNLQKSKDAQIIEAETDIKLSSDNIARLETLDKNKFPFIDSLINFHQIRIKNCSDAIQKYYKEMK